jgi:hypothetical protein
MFNTAISSLLRVHPGREPQQGGPPRLDIDGTIFARLTRDHSSWSNDGEPRLLPERAAQRFHRRLVFVRERERPLRVTVSDLFELVFVAPDRLPARP